MPMTALAARLPAAPAEFQILAKSLVVPVRSINGVSRSIGSVASIA